MTRKDVLEKLAESKAITFISNDSYITNDGISDVEFFGNGQWLNIGILTITGKRVFLHYKVVDIKNIYRDTDDLIIELNHVSQLSYIPLEAL